MARLAYLQTNARAAARLASALEEDHALTSFPDWEGLLDGLDRHSFDGCIIDLDDLSRPVTLGELESLRGRHPVLAIVVCSAFGGREIELFHLGRIGIDGVVIAEAQEDALSLRAAVTSALAGSMASAVVREARDLLPALGLQCVRAGIENAGRPYRVGDLAARMDVSPGTLNRRLRSLGLPNAGRFLLWGKLFVAAHLFKEGSRTVEDVAYALRYSGATALRRVVKKQLGVPPSGIPARGGVSFVLDSFLRVELGRGS